MNKERTQTPFILESTQDGSPTFKIKNGGESMHHSGGAATETQYIYKTPIEWALGLLNECHVHVVGLGLAYIEISWAIELAKLNKHKKIQSSLTSFETELSLVKNFEGWLRKQKVNSDSFEVYDQICNYLKPEASIADIKSILLNNLEKIKVKGDLRVDYKNSQKAHVICFDAFSSKTSQELWSESFLNEYLKTSAEENCVFTTYACTGVLKRALKDNGFKLHERLGFKGKRDSTFAVRGVFKDVETPYRTS